MYKLGLFAWACLRFDNNKTSNSNSEKINLLLKKISKMKPFKVSVNDVVGVKTYNNKTFWLKQILIFSVNENRI